MGSRKNQLPLGIFTGVCFTLLLISTGLILAINLRALYRMDISYLNIEQTSGYSKAVILENYNALIDYCSPFFQGPLIFPTLPSSPQGLQHFAEVKNIFTAFYYLLVISLALLIPAILYARRHHYHKLLKISAITTVILPVIVGLTCSINFDRAFILFHKLFFRNDYWLFDPATDPIIDLLPSEFFLHCAIVIIVVVILGSLGQAAVYKVRSRKLEC